MKNFKKIFPWVLAIFWMALIFYLSHQPATKSNGLSTGITEIIINTVEKVVPQVDFDLSRLNHIVRKNAHFFAYLVLGILVINALHSTEKNRKKDIILALFICVLYAISDEVHQLFIPGRAAQIRDVMIDSAGAIVGIFGYKIARNGVSHLNNNKIKN